VGFLRTPGGVPCEGTCTTWLKNSAKEKSGRVSALATPRKIRPLVAWDKKRPRCEWGGAGNANGEKKTDVRADRRARPEKEKKGESIDIPKMRQGEKDLKVTGHGKELSSTKKEDSHRELP